MDEDMSIPQPIKVEDWTFIDLDFDIHEWIKTVDKKLSDYDSCWSEDSLDEVMRWYIDSFKKDASNILKMASICKRHMQQRMLFFYICESDINLQRSTFSKTYFDNMEDILAFYINVEIFSGVLRKQDNSRNYNRLLRKTARRIINMLNQYLCLRDTLQDHLIRKHHVLMKMEINDKSTETKDLLNILYEKLITGYPKNKSDLAFCRSYILYQKWKILREPSDWLQMNELLYKMYDRTPESIENNFVLKQILLSKNNSILDVLTHISNNHLVMTKAYFKFIQGDECLGDYPVHNYHALSTIMAPESKPRLQKQYLKLLSGLTISNTPSKNTKREVPNGKMSFSAGDRSKTEPTNKTVRSNKVKIPNKTKSNTTEVSTRKDKDDDDDDVQIISSETVKYVLEIPHDDDLCEIVYVEKEANPSFGTNNESFLDSIDILEYKLKGTPQRKNMRNRPKLRKANKTSPNTNLSEISKQNGPAKEVIVDISEQSDSEREVIDISGQDDSKNEVVTDANKQSKSGKEVSTDTSKQFDSQKEASSETCIQIDPENEIISGRDIQNDPKKGVGNRINDKMAQNVNLTTTETQTDSDFPYNNNNNNNNKREYIYKNHYGLVTPPSDQHSEEPDLSDRPLVYMERVMESDENQASTPLFLSENLERIENETHNISSNNFIDKDIEQRAPKDITTSAFDTIPAETVSNVISTINTPSSNDKLKNNTQPTENNKTKFHKNRESREPELNPDVNVVEFSESITCEGSRLIPSSISKTSNHLIKSSAGVRPFPASPVISNICTVSDEDNIEVLTSNKNVHNTNETARETVSNDNHSPKENSECIESVSAKKTSQSDEEPVEACHIETESHNVTLESNTSEKSNDGSNEEEEHHLDTSGELTECVSETEDIHIEANKQITKELTVSLEKIPIPEEEQSVERTRMSEQNDRYLLKNYLNFDAPSAILKDCYKDQYMDSILSGPVEKPGASYEHINPDKTFDLFDNRICSTPIEQIAHTNTDLPTINSEIISPTYEEIDDFRNFYEDNKNTEKLNNIETNATSAISPQSPDPPTSGEIPVISSKSLHSFSDHSVEVRLPNNFQEHSDRYSAVPLVANNNKRKRISFADLQTEMEFSRRPLLSPLKPNGVSQSVIATNAVQAISPRSPDHASSRETPIISSTPLYSYSDNSVEVRLPNNFQEHSDEYSAVPVVANNSKRKRISFADPETEMDISRRPLLTSLKPNGVLQSVLKKPSVTTPQIKKTTRPRIPRRLLNMKSLATHNMQPDDLYLQSEPYVDLIRLREEEIAQALRINMVLQRARENENKRDSSVKYRVDYDKRGSLDIGKNDIVQYKGKSIPLTVMQQRFRTYDSRTTPPVRQKERGYNPADLANVDKRFGKRKRRGCSPALEANAEDVGTVSSRPLSSRSGRILKPILRKSMVPKKTDNSFAIKR